MTTYKNVDFTQEQVPQKRCEVYFDVFPPVQPIIDEFMNSLHGYLSVKCLQMDQDKPKSSETEKPLRKGKLPSSPLNRSKSQA